METTASGVRAVEVALDILEAVAFCDGEIGVSQIAAQLGLAKGAAFRHLNTLVERGYLMRNPATARYQIGVKFELLGRLGRREASLFTAAEGPMTALRDALGETIVLSALEPSGPRVLATAPGHATIEIGVRPGSSLRFDASAQGKVMLAFAPPEIAARFAKTADAERAAALARELRRARRQGWLESKGDVMRGINAIAAPVFAASGECAGALAVVGLFDLAREARTRRFLSALLAAAERVSTNLGRRGAGPWRTALPATPAPGRSRARRTAS